MSLLDQLGNLLGKYGSPQTSPSDDEARKDYDQIAPHASASSLSGALAAAFRSDKTPPFHELLGGMFGQASGPQRAGLLNTLISAVGLTHASQILGGPLGGKLSGSADDRRLSPEEADQVSHQAATDLAREAERRDPSVVDRVSSFSASHPGLVKSIGAGALGILLSHVAHSEQHG
jgi:hypothetical protein